MFEVKDKMLRAQIPLYGGVQWVTIGRVVVVFVSNDKVA